MSRILRLGVFLLPACVSSPATETRESAIVGGEIAQTADFPTVVALEAAPGQWFCTGTLIAADWVLTAAHCVEGETAATMKIRLGDNNINDTTGGIVVAVAAVYAHPDYDGFAWDNDVAVIRLATPVTDRTPTPIHRAMPATATPMIQVGYGAVDDNDMVAGVLHRLATTSIDCAVTGDASIMAQNVVCFDQRDGNGTCYGDSGGPSFVDVGGMLEVAAITSGGTVESCLDGFDIQTSVAGELEFIDAAISGALEPPAPEEPDPTPPVEPEPVADSGGGCNTGGSASLLVGLAAMLLRRRRATRRPAPAA